MLISLLTFALCFEIIFFFFLAEDGIRDKLVTGVQTCALPIWAALRSLAGPAGGGPAWSPQCGPPQAAASARPNKSAPEPPSAAPDRWPTSLGQPALAPTRGPRPIEGASRQATRQEDRPCASCPSAIRSRPVTASTAT